MPGTPAAADDPALDRLRAGAVSRMRTVLRHRSLRRLLVGLAASQFGDWLYNVALLAYVYDRTHSAAWLGLTTAARVLPAVLLGPLGGIVADRYDRRKAMITCDLVRVAVMATLALVATTGAWLALVPLLAAVATSAGVPYPACTAASLARLVPAGELGAANAVRSVIVPICLVTGPAAGALVLAVGGAGVAFGINATTFAVSAVAVAAIGAGPAFRSAALDGQRRPDVWAELRDGAHALLAHRLVLRLVGADVLTSFVYGVLTVALLFVSTDIGLPGDGYGVLLAATGAGGVAGTVVAARIVDRGRPVTAVVTALTIVAVPLPLLAITGSLGTALVLASAGGAGAMVVEVLTDTTLQCDLDEAVLARAYGFAFPAAISGILIGGAVAAPLIAVVGLLPALGVIGLAVGAYALWLPRGVHVPGASALATADL